MHTAPRVLRLLPVLAAALLAVLLVAPARSEILEDKALNYSFETPSKWVRAAANNSWAKLGIVAGATRELTKLDGGKAAKGEGAQVHLSVIDAPEGKDIDALSADEEVRGFLLNRFGKPGNWPEVDVTKTAYDEGLPLHILVAEGKSPNLKGKKAKTRAVMLLVLARGKVYKLRMYAWPTEFDAEGLKTDLDLIEINFDIIDKSAVEDRESEGERPDLNEEDEEPADVGDEAEVKEMGDPELGWKLVKPAGVRSKPESEWKSTYPDAVAWFEANTNKGFYQVYLTIFRKGRVINGQQAPDVDLKNWITKDWWPIFTANHPEGPITTFKWPKKSPTFITLPDFDDPATEVMAVEKPKRRPAEADAGDMIKKLKVVEKVKNKRLLKLGKEKANEAYRGIMKGARPRVGREIVVRYAWGTPRLSCELVISMARGAERFYAKPLRELLESIEMTGRQ